MTNTSRIRGFTMIELLVAATIIAVLTAIGLVSFTSANQNARNAKRKADLEQVRSALELYRTDTGSYPLGPFPNAVGVLAQNKYLSSPTIQDPKGVAPYIYTYTVLGTTYTLSALLEPTGTPYTLNNP